MLCVQMLTSGVELAACGNFIVCFSELCLVSLPNFGVSGCFHVVVLYVVHSTDVEFYLLLYMPLLLHLRV